ncbi:hypothetical protein TREES_T100001646 [Tupaia chinensis]|uniref:Uncharacterized protein n=1 Tax=Tupaia chinensis TaxID=246437 RepID=L9KP28_TUPCH|nr:hypothetical protein TREES_T100001646 [Tupaia chinensis]
MELRTVSLGHGHVPAEEALGTQETAVSSGYLAASYTWQHAMDWSLHVSAGFSSAAQSLGLLRMCIGSAGFSSAAQSLGLLRMCIGWGGKRVMARDSFVLVPHEEEQQFKELKRPVTPSHSWGGKRVMARDSFVLVPHEEEQQFKELKSVRASVDSGSLGQQQTLLFSFAGSELFPELAARSDPHSRCQRFPPRAKPCCAGPGSFPRLPELAPIPGYLEDTDLLRTKDADV